MDVRRTPDLVERPCPYVHRGDTRCSGRFGLPRLRQMFGYCFGQPTACPVYHRLQRERADPLATRQPVRPLRSHRPAVELTVCGRPLDHPSPLATAA